MLDNAVGHSLRICVAINIKYDSFLVCKETEDTQLLLLLLLLSLLGCRTYQIFLAGNWPSWLGHHILAAVGRALNELHLLACRQHAVFCIINLALLMRRRSRCRRRWGQLATRQTLPKLISRIGHSSKTREARWTGRGRGGKWNT